MKTDLKKTLDSFKAKHNDFAVIDVPPAQYLMVDGHGAPYSQSYTDALATLYPVAYKLKFASKANDKDFVVPPLEGLWWADDMTAFTDGRKDEWDWTMMIMMPDWITPAMFADVLQIVAEKGLPSIGKIRLETLHEGMCVQYLHIGSYADEAPMLKVLHEDFVPNNAYKMTGKHHEIYLSDPRKVAPEKLKTIIRQPVEL